MQPFEKREKLDGWELYGLYQQFEAQWFPSEDVDTTLDFLLWLMKKGCGIILPKD